MSYEAALAAAGAKVHAFESFGSYQGDWWAKVTLSDGRSGYVHGYFGSCSGCDAFQAEFGYGAEACEDHEYQPKARADCSACAIVASTYQQKLAAFGNGYLEGLLTQVEAEADAAKDIQWDQDAEKELAWLKAQAADVESA